MDLASRAPSLVPKWQVCGTGLGARRQAGRARGSPARGEGSAAHQAQTNLPESAQARLVLPPVVTGYLLLVLLGRRGPVGGYLAEWFGVAVVFTWKGRRRARR
jgi:hypothetical protein